MEFFFFVFAIFLYLAQLMKWQFLRLEPYLMHPPPIPPSPHQPIFCTAHLLHSPGLEDINFIVAIKYRNVWLLAPPATKKTVLSKYIHVD